MNVTTSSTQRAVGAGLPRPRRAPKVVMLEVSLTMSTSPCPLKAPSLMAPWLSTDHTRRSQRRVPLAQDFRWYLQWSCLVLDLPLQVEELLGVQADDVLVGGDLGCVPVVHHAECAHCGGVGGRKGSAHDDL